MSKIVVLIPCYNEAFTVAKVVSDYREALPEADRMCCKMSVQKSKDDVLIHERM